jgi:hypothetical protein
MYLQVTEVACESCSQQFQDKLYFLLQCSLDLPFFKGPAKMVDEYGETVNPENHFF